MSEILALDLHGAIAIVVRTLVVYVALLAMLRVLGKRHVGQLSLFDFVLVLLISNAVQNAMVGPDSSLTGGLLAAVVLVAMNALLSRFAIGHKHFGALLEGEPTLLIRDGLILVLAIPTRVYTTKGPEISRWGKASNFILICALQWFIVDLRVLGWAFYAVGATLYIASGLWYGYKVLVYLRRSRGHLVR